MKIRLGLRLMLTGGLFLVMAAHAYAVPALSDGSRVVFDSNNVVMAPEGSSSNISAATVETRAVPGAEDGRALAASSVTAGETVSGIAGVGMEAAKAPPIKTLEFNEQFRGTTAPNWVPKSGVWSIAKNSEKKNDYLVSQGVANNSATVIYNKDFTNFGFRVRMMRHSSAATFSNRIIIRASGTFGTDGHFANEYEFQYSRDGWFSVYGRADGSVFILQDWTQSDAINRQSAWNELRVYANGENLGLVINGQQVWTGTDSNSLVGLVGMSFYKDDVSTNNKLLIDYAILQSFSEPTSQAKSIPPHLLILSNIERLMGRFTSQ